MADAGIVRNRLKIESTITNARATLALRDTAGGLDAYFWNFVDGRLMQLLLDEVAVLPSLPLHLPQPTDPDLLTICRVLADAPDDASTLGDWAGRLGVDAKTIQRRFARQTGMTFGQWRQQARLVTALEQLAAGVKVVDVALNLGYNSPSAFATMFKRQFGASPSGYFR